MIAQNQPFEICGQEQKPNTLTDHNGQRDNAMQKLKTDDDPRALACIIFYDHVPLFMCIRRKSSAGLIVAFFPLREGIFPVLLVDIPGHFAKNVRTNSRSSGIRHFDGA